MSNANQTNLVKGSHKNVMEMVREHLSDDQEFVNELAAHLKEREMVKILAVLRSRANLSQKDMALKTGCKQPRISKLESGVDDDIRFGDILSYLKATNHEVRIFFLPAGMTLADEVKMHASVIHRLFSRMVKLAGNDTAIVKGVAEFIEEAQHNLTRLTQIAAESLPDCGQRASRLVEVDAPQVKKSDDKVLPPAPTTDKGKKKKKTVTAS